jgi:6-phosphofructokinase 1
MSTLGDIQRIGILTGGGDCPGLNAVIRSVTREALFAGLEVFGIEDGFLGLIEDRVRPLSHDNVSNILGQGGTILGTSNKANPVKFAVGQEPDGSPRFADVSDRCLRTLETRSIDALVVIGGDGSMACAHALAGRGGRAARIIGVPKTIDNDIVGSDLTFGFLSAVDIATQAIDRVTTTAASHHRVMVVEVMGRNAGWIALYAGVASGSDVILIPEIPFHLDAVARAVKERIRIGRRHTIVCVAEGARVGPPTSGNSRGQEQVAWRIDPTSPDPVRLGGVSRVIAESVELLTGVESRWVVLGHTQRGGDPTPEDRLLGTLMGHHAMTLLRGRRFGHMVAIRGQLAPSALSEVPLEVAAQGQRTIPVGAHVHPLIDAARGVGTRFGDES